ncbi:MAG: hypothetical protein GXO79_01115 [Chlorobi bacterium]|nr:hypothetical protein [Chlorobiota bacterium]
MDNFTNKISNSEFITGIILLIVFIFVPVFKIEKLGTSIIKNQYKQRIARFQISEVENRNNSIKNEINELQQVLMNSKSVINELMQQTYALNEEINTSFTDSLINKQIADSLDHFYNNKLSLNDRKIDSASIKFNEQSDSLIIKLIKLKNYSNLSLELNIKNEKLDKHIFVFWYKILFVIIYLLIMIFGIKKAKKMIQNCD